MRRWPRPAPPPARGGGEWRPRTGFSAARLPAGTARPTRPASALPHTARSLSRGPEPPSHPTSTGLGPSIRTQPALGSPPHPQCRTWRPHSFYKFPHTSLHPALGPVTLQRPLWPSALADPAPAIVCFSLQPQLWSRHPTEWSLSSACFHLQSPFRPRGLKVAPYSPPRHRRRAGSISLVPAGPLSLHLASPPSSRATSGPGFAGGKKLEARSPWHSFWLCSPPSSGMG